RRTMLQAGESARENSHKTRIESEALETNPLHVAAGRLVTLYFGYPAGSRSIAMLSKKQVQLSRMFLDVAHGIEQQLGKAEHPSGRPWELAEPACFFWSQRFQRGAAFGACIPEVGL